jgi:hypothetical protein
MAEPVRIIGHNKNSKTNEYLQAQVGANGSLQVQDEGWVCSDTSETADPYYYGFVDKTGAWYIMRRAISLGQFRFAAGSSGYTVAWSLRADQTYDYYYNVFPI